MVNSTLLYMLEMGEIAKWEKEIKSAFDIKLQDEEIEKIENKLKETLDATKTKLMYRYRTAITNRVETVQTRLSYKILNLGIKLGMEIQKEFAIQEEEQYSVAINNLTK